MKPKFTRERLTTEPLGPLETLFLTYGGGIGRPNPEVVFGMFGGERGARRAWETHREQIEASWDGKGPCWAARHFDGADA